MGGICSIPKSCTISGLPTSASAVPPFIPLATLMSHYQQAFSCIFGSRIHDAEEDTCHWGCGLPRLSSDRRIAGKGALGCWCRQLRDREQEQSSASRAECRVFF